VLAPAGTPADVLSRLQAALGAALAAPRTLERFRELGVEAAPDLATPAAFSEFLRREFERSREAAQLAGLKKE
jgi:tripartite-type tricarboxylate transporter receptor subunit TctC